MVGLLLGSPRFVYVWSVSDVDPAASPFGRPAERRFVGQGIISCSMCQHSIHQNHPKSKILVTRKKCTLRMCPQGKICRKPSEILFWAGNHGFLQISARTSAWWWPSEFQTSQALQVALSTRRKSRHKGNKGETWRMPDT